MFPIKRLISLFLLCALLLLPVSGCAPAPKQPMPILMYHHIVPDGEECVGMTVTVSRFREDMQWLMDQGYTFVLPRELAAGEQLPEKPVMVTFDDGYSSNYHVLFPILQEMNVKIALALVVSMPDVREADSFLSWDMCQEMSDSGLVEFGSHTYDLHNFDGRGGAFTPDGVNGIQRREGESREDYEARVRGDLQAGVDAIERELGTEVCYFAYPYGVTDPWATDFVHALFSVTVTSRPAVADLDNGLYEMDRLTVSMDESVPDLLK